jgi:hypothetical protein
MIGGRPLAACSALNVSAVNLRTLALSIACLDLAYGKNAGMPSTPSTMGDDPR